MSALTRTATVETRTPVRAILAVLFGLSVLTACQAADDGGAEATESEAAAAPSPEESVADDPGSASGSGEVTVTVSETAAGPALAGEDGMTLYVLFGDNEDGSGCTDSCENAWPPFVVEEGTEVAAADDVSGELGTTTRPDGSTQVTMNLRPLYYYSGDTSPGDANGHEVGDVWFVAEQ